MAVHGEVRTRRNPSAGRAGRLHRAPTAPGPHRGTRTRGRPRAPYRVHLGHPRALGHPAPAQPIRNPAGPAPGVVPAGPSAHDRGSANPGPISTSPRKGSPMTYPAYDTSGIQGAELRTGTVTCSSCGCRLAARGVGHVPPLRTDGRPRRARLQGRVRRRGPRPQGAGARRRLTRPAGGAARRATHHTVTAPGHAPGAVAIPVCASRSARRVGSPARVRQRGLLTRGRIGPTRDPSHEWYE